ncbi:flagellar FlbD family protein [Alkaliphilus serpentinus]|uniref:Flagellar FlbD family protein n=1 Tax=Alkaliphilus serpentinus TaxID=1482731 RepID=A0A833HPV7_9FIRM|nr:flagellar FlbD family protein [Alkaliphilus serpentinus]KAB3531379.1 flagellar FlbD family protein [Alkaliphilus serpentinus]
MIKLIRINNTHFVLNADLIEMIEETPDTVITLLNGHKMIVSNTADEVIDLVVAYKQRIYSGISYKE